MDIHSYWKDTLNQDISMRQYFDENAKIFWHNTNEVFTLDEFIIANCEYLGKWDVEIEKIYELKDTIITAVRVFEIEKNTSFHVVSFIKLLNDKIIQIDEYWGDDTDVPKWRADKNIGNKII